MSTDTDYVSFTLKVGNDQPLTWTKSMGDLSGGTYPVNLSFGPVPVASNEAVIMNYMIVNSGHQDPSFIEKTLESTGSQLATKAGTEVGTDVGNIILPGIGSLIGSALGAIAGWLVDQISSLLTANCDGPVAAEQDGFRSSDLWSYTASGGIFRHSTTHPGTDSPSGCGENSLYIVNWHIVREQVRTFQAIDLQNIFVLGSDANLWLEHAPFGKVPPARQQVDGNVRTFQALDTQNVIVLGRDGKLWLEWAPFGKVPPARLQIDANVVAFQALDASNVLVLGYDGNLWLEHAPFGNVPPARQQIDGNVWSFQPLDGDHVLVLGTDGNLWLEQAPFGKVPPARQQIDANVA